MLNFLPNFTHDKRRKRQNKYTRLGLKYHCWYCWVAFNYAPSFYFLLEMYCLRSILWPNYLASSRIAIVKTCWWHRLDNSNLKGLFCSKGWNVLLMEWMKTKHLCHGSIATIEDVNICRSSSGGKKSFIQRTPIQLHCWIKRHLSYLHYCFIRKHRTYSRMSDLRRHCANTCNLYVIFDCWVFQFLKTLPVCVSRHNKK